MLSHGCLFCRLSYLSVTLVYCGQTIGWMKMKLGMEVGLGPGHFVLGVDPPPKKRPNTLYFSADVYCGQKVAHLSY